MKCFLLGFVLLTSWAQAELKSGYLTPEEQKYYKNDSFDGNNQRERTDSNVREINKLIGEVTNLKSEVADLKRQVEELKKGK